MDQKTYKAWRSRAVGNDGDLIILGRQYEDSFQEWNLDQLEFELNRDWAEQADKIYKAIHR